VKTARLIARAYQGAVAFYPRRFRADYGEEMVGVFSQACQDAAGISTWAACRLGLRELAELPANLLRAYWSELWRETSALWRSIMEGPSGIVSFRKSTLRGMLIFGLSFMLITLVYSLIDTLLNHGHNLQEGISVFRYLYIQPTALASGLGAAILGFAIGRKKAWLSALASFLGYNLFSVAWHFAIDLPFRAHPTGFYYLVVPFILQAIAGILVGGGIGYFQRGREYAARYAWYGALGFMAGWFIDRILASLLLTQFTLPYFTAEKFSHMVIGSPWYFIYILAPTLAYGVIVGLALGMAPFKREKRQLALA
jgi:hypothetical protein